MGLDTLSPRGIVVTHLEADPALRRVYECLHGHACPNLDVVELGEFFCKVLEFAVRRW